MLCQQDSHEGIAVRNYKTLRLLQTAQSKNVGFVVNKIFFFKVSSVIIFNCWDLSNYFSVICSIDKNVLSQSIYI